MNKDELFAIAVAYTAKTSEASTPEQFLQDVEKNKEAFEALDSSNKKEWVY